MRITKTVPALLMAAIAAMAIAGCGDDDKSSSTAGDLSGQITLDGSSTVFPFAQSAAELFNGVQPNVKIPVGTSGTGGGFKKFCAGETDISNASRPIDSKDEVPECEKNGISYTELQVASDGIAVITNADLKVDCLTTDQLKQIWNKESKVASLKEVDPKLPDTKLSLYGPGQDSGTFDYFTDVINGDEGDTRKDYQPSEDDNVLVEGVSGDDGGLGYFGFSYFEQNKDKLNLVAVDGGSGCVKPSLESIQDGSYKPLSRPIFMYVSGKALARPEVKQFLETTLEKNSEIATAAEIVPMSDDATAKSQQALADAGQ